MKQQHQILFLILLVFTFLSSCSSINSFDDKFEEIVEQPVKGKDKTPNTRPASPKPPKTSPHSKKSPPVETRQQDPEKILSDYRLGKGDVISIKVFGEEDFSLETALSKEGRISYPFLGDLKLSGLSVNQVENQITLGLKGDYLRNPKVTVTILEYRQLFVNGEVKTPGGYAFKPGMTVNKAISLGGGFTETASREEIFIIRDGDKSVTEKKVGLFSFVSPGDIIIVREYKKFFVNGEVKSPGGYEYIPNLTVDKAISIAGGLGEFASSRWSKMFVIRDTDKSGRQVRVHLKSPIFPGDILTVEETTF